MKALKSNILSPGTKFVVTDNTVDGTFGPGTTGFISYVKGIDQDYPNVIYLDVSVIKRGKTGKDRLDSSEISTPIFLIDDDEIKQFMPDEKRKYYVYINPIEVTIDLMSFCDLDFLAWAMSYARYISKLSSKVKNFPTWPSDPNNILNTMLHMGEYFTDDAVFMMNTYASESSRHNFIKNIRSVESMLVRNSVNYMSKTATLEFGAVKYIYQHTLDKFKNDLMILTYNYFEQKKSVISQLEVSNRRSDLTKLRKAIKSTLSWS